MFKQLISFGLIGVISTLTHVGTLVVLVEWFHLPPMLATTVGFVLAVVVSYGLNYRYTFAAEGSHARYFPKYATVSVGGFLLNTLIMYTTTHILEWWYLLGQMVTLLIVPVFNFLCNRYWTFESERAIT